MNAKKKIYFKIKCRFCEKFISFNNFGNHLQSKNCNHANQKATIDIESDNKHSFGTVHLQEEQEYFPRHYRPEVIDEPRNILSLADINEIDGGFRC